MDSWLTLLPPCLSILLAITTKQVYVAIFAGIMAGSILLSHNVLLGITNSFNAVADTFQSSNSVKSLIFILMIGAIINVMKQSGGIDTLIYQLVYKRNIVKSKGSAQLITIAFGFLMCLEGVGSMMLIGLVGRPLFNQFDISREKLAFIANCTGAPLAWLMPFSGAGIFLASLIAVQVENGTLDKPPMYYVLAALPYQIYTMAILALVLLLALKQHDFTAQSTSANQVNIVPSSDHQPQTSILAIILPVAILLASILVITYVTRDISSAVYWSGFISLIGSGIYFRVCKVNINQYVEWCVKGMENMLPAAIILTLAFSLSGITGELGTGKYLASFVSNEVPIWLVPASIFVICVLISFSTGSSGATVSIMTPIIIPLAVSIGISVPLVIATVISGAVFGDQSSPISDSVVVASSAANCPPAKHFATQLPYTLAVALLSLMFYLIMGFYT
ncbi:Na+/H+ antiporter NhaC family protein [Photobacterium carnosum]|uniref:Sodium:proton antiporter n=1 Tax=Photobacterium carnosum TaxID=2023717 RepID=A0A2N4UXA4_9GAMM|nr:Na+/H+ antiporter NhaC family protein [Photobacterium carnosum]MCD9493828.1 sodium:proton antiporter [Photobacterium carnosum]MCD9540160.1 sodium:proton antiporter [Photobacterium carnosum]MCF2152635.1 sodium:proton antiporter [Photobacterium carnosum]MCF2214395.1 sodium:proton antiporter [Photobacterium carnosum]PLC59657.1 sodium:proton antiporter [Photobacterium carnosum]